jgi:aquaporin Z
LRREKFPALRDLQVFIVLPCWQMHRIGLHSSVGIAVLSSLIAYQRPFNPAVTAGNFITKRITSRQLPLYFAAEIIGAILASLFVKYMIGNYANLGANVPNYNFTILVIFFVEVVASALLMAIILVVVYTKGLKGFSGIAIGGIVGLDIFFSAFISGASINPARSLGPVLISGSVGDLSLYCSAPFIGTSIIAFLLR